jgi:hypothetical protein
MILFRMIPWVGMFRARRPNAKDYLIELRAVFLAFSGSLVAFAIVLPLVGGARDPKVLPWLAILAAMALLTTAATEVLVRKPLDCATPVLLAQTYRARFFLVIAFSELVALFGFVSAFIGGPIWIYDVGAAFALFRFWTVSPPTRSALAREQRQLSARGCELSLIAALRSSPPPTRAGR